MEVEVKWIKLLTRFFDDEKIKLIEAMPDADTIIVIWVKLLTLAGKKNMNGYIFLAENIPYTDEMLSTLFNRPLNTIRLALDIFKKFKMVKFNNDGIAKINNWEKHQNIEGLDKIREQGRLRQIKHRDKFKQLPEKASNVTVTSHNETEEKRRDKKEIKKEIKNIKNTTIAPSDKNHSELKPIITITLNDKTEYPITQDMVTEWKSLYPAVNILQALRDIRGWNLSKPRQRKTKRGIMSHINTWLSKEQNSGSYNKPSNNKGGSYGQIKRHTDKYPEGRVI